MSIIIKGEWRMPKKCRECLLCEPYNDGTENEFCIPTGKPLIEGETPQDPKGEGRSCPLVELPEKHGDLIDRDALIRDHFSPEHRIALSEANKTWMRKIINDAPTIVESEGK